MFCWFSSFMPGTRTGVAASKGATPVLWCSFLSCLTAVWSAGEVAAVDGQCPDNQHIKGDDDQAPYRVVGQPHEVQDGAQRGDGDADGASPDGAVEHEESGDQHEHADDQVDPTPGGEVELEGPFLADDVEVVVEQCDQTLQGMQRANHDHGNAGEDDGTDSQAAARPFIGGRGHTNPFYCEYCLRCPPDSPFEMWAAGPYQYRAHERSSAARLKYLYDLMRENQVCELSRWDCGMVTGTF